MALVVTDPCDLSQDVQACSALADAIERANIGLGPRERIDAHAVVADAWLPGALLTETLKMRRPQIAERYTTTIEQLYAPAGQSKDTGDGPRVA